MTKAEVKKLLPYNTLSKCEKAYREEIKKAFEFEGVDVEKTEIIKACVFNIFTSISGDSRTQLEKVFCNKENRIKAFEEFKKSNYNKMYLYFFE